MNNDRDHAPLLSLLLVSRNWVKLERDQGRKGVYPVYTVRPPFSILTPISVIDIHRILQLALVQWKLNFFLHV